MTLPAIELVNGTGAEARTEQCLAALLREYPLDRWLHTAHVRIDERARVPHSHPVLTLNARYSGEELLSAYVHEQLHWYVAWPGDRPPIFEELGRRYPDLPVEPPAGCGSAFSNVLHLVVNSLEYVSLADLLGEEAARELLLRKHYHRTIYRTLLADQDELVPLITAQGWLPLP
ncbi:hypothetical protein [Flindersiella endophytica]